jgi:acyl-CoA dehydrogenase family protein 11
MVSENNNNSNNGTTPVRDVQVKDRLQVLEKYLADNISSFRGPLSVSQFVAGQSNPTFLLNTPSQRYVLRKKPAGKLLPSAHAVDREYQIISQLHSVGFPVPKPFLFCSNPDVLGVDFYVMQFVEGRIFRDPTLPTLSPKERRLVYEEATRVLARLHQLNWQKLGLSNFGKDGSTYYSRQISVWSRGYTASKTQTFPEMDNLMSWLPQNIPSNDGRTSIVHGDFRIDNVVFHPTEFKIIAVLDWELSTLGHPIADVAYFTIPYLYDPNPSVVPMTAGVAGLTEKGIPSLKEVLDLYCKETQRQSIEKFYFYHAFSLFRGASILQGVYKRALQGNASSPSAKEAGSLAHDLAKKGWQIVTENDKTAAAGGGKSGPSPTSGNIFEYSPKVQELRKKLISFMKEHVVPGEKVYLEQQAQLPSRWMIPPIMEELKAKAKKEGLWNLFLPHVPQHLADCGGPGLTNLEYAPLCEIMGRHLIAPEIFNCAAPDTGNMEVLAMYGNRAQQEKWLRPLLNGEIRSCFAMTEPDVASSDATNISCSIRKQGSNYVVNGRKWWTSGAGDPRCKVAITMVRSEGSESLSRHRRHSMILIPMDTPGVKVVRALPVFNYDDAPHGHCEVVFDNVVVPEENMILGEGRGFEIAQGRLGPGRIHHCMRLIGLSERALELMIERAKSRVAFGKPLAAQGVVRNQIALSRIEIDQARLLTLKAAHLMDTAGNKGARSEIAMIKVVAPRMACTVIDRAIQVHGGGGVSNDFPLAYMYAGARTLRLADGPDEVHIETIARIALSQMRGDSSEEDKQFEAAQAEVTLLDPAPEHLLQLYAWYKQATTGDCNTEKPADARSLAKWEAWNDKKGITKQDAQKGYIKLVASLKAAKQSTSKL